MITNQVYVFLKSIGVGAALVFLFDIFRLFRYHRKIKNVVVYLQDVIYIFICAWMIIMSAFLTNHGEIRGYMIIGYFMGGALYLLLLSGIFMKIMSSFIFFIEQTWKNSIIFIKRIFLRRHFLNKNKGN